LFGPGTFEFGWSGGARFFDPSESSHLHDARTLLLVFLALVAVSLIGLVAVLARRGGDPQVWRAAGRGGLALAALLLAGGVAFLVAFDIAFELFHRVFFPQGNWAFDPSRQRMVQLYPIAFWQYASAALATLSIAAGLALWAVARTRRSMLTRSTAATTPGAIGARGTEAAVSSSPPAR
jgi:integral membrane protein (TIGR01906 family)